MKGGVGKGMLGTNTESPCTGLNVPGRQRHRGGTENSPSVSNLVGGEDRSESTVREREVCF